MISSPAALQAVSATGQTWTAMPAMWSERGGRDMEARLLGSAGFRSGIASNRGDRRSLGGPDGGQFGLGLGGGGRIGSELSAQEAQGDLDRVWGIGPQPRGVIGLDLEQLDTDEAVVSAVSPTGEAVSLGPLAGQRRIGPAQVRAILRVVGQQDLRGVAVDGPFLGPFGL